MTNANFRRTLASAAVAAALGVLGTPASAAPYRGSFDPTNFAGEYEINVSAACLLTNGWHANTGICTAQLVSAYADVISDDVTPNFNGRLIFAPPVVPAPTLHGIFVYGGQIDSFDTDLIHFQAGSDPTADDWWIQFVSGHECYGGPCGPIITFAPDAQPEGASDINPFLKGVYLWLNDGNSPIAMAQYLGPAVDIGVPEPGTLSLLLGALGGGWLARRRRKEKEADSS